MPTFLSVAAENCPANLRFPSFEFNVIPLPALAVINKFPADEVWKNSISVPIANGIAEDADN